jgi:hypothetical protein
MIRRSKKNRALTVFVSALGGQQQTSLRARDDSSSRIRDSGWQLRGSDLDDIAEVGGYMMLESLAADVLQQLLQLGNLGHARAAEGGQRIVGELARSDIAADYTATIVGRVARIAHRAALDAAHAGAEGVFLAHGAGNDLLEVHLDFVEEVLGQVGAVEADALIGMAAVVVVPVEQRGRRAGGQRQHVHAERAGYIHFAGRGIRSLDIMLMMVQGTTPKYSSSEVQHCTALMVTEVPSSSRRSPRPAWTS